jgi:hypothetical protein
MAHGRKSMDRSMDRPASASLKIRLSFAFLMGFQPQAVSHGRIVTFSDMDRSRLK